MTHKLKQIAQSGFSNAASYDQYRPSYPAESVDKLLRALGIAGVKGARILDLAAGTGKFTEKLAQRPEEYEILAVEPHGNMRAALEKKGLRRVEVVDGYAEAMGKVEDGWADAVVAAQAFHWFSTMPALREIHRVLALGGAFGMIWNIEDYNSPHSWEPTTPYEAKMKQIMWDLDDEEKRFKHLAWKEVFDQQLKTDPLSVLGADPFFSLPLGEHTTKWEVWLSKENAWKRYSTISHVANLSGEKREEIERQVWEALDEAPANEKGEVAIHGLTYTSWTTAIPADTLKNGG